MRQVIEKKGMLVLFTLAIGGFLFASCGDDDNDDILNNEMSYSFSSDEKNVINAIYEADWILDQQVVDYTTIRLEGDNLQIAHFPNKIILDWLIDASGHDAPMVIEDAESEPFCIEYNGKSDIYQYYAAYGGSDGKIAGNSSEYGVFINGERYTVTLFFAEPLTAIYHKSDEFFAMHMKVSALILSRYLKDYTQEVIEHQFNSLLELTLVTTKSLPYSY